MCVSRFRVERVWFANCGKVVAVVFNFFFSFYGIRFRVFSICSFPNEFVGYGIGRVDNEAYKNGLIMFFEVLGRVFYAYGRSFPIYLLLFYVFFKVMGRLFLVCFRNFPSKFLLSQFYRVCV